MRRRIGFISEHASPLAVIGGTDGGGQNIYVGQLARQLAERGYDVDVFTRRDDPRPPEIVPLAPGVRVIHVPAGPARFIRKEDLLPWMGDFAVWMMGFCRREETLYELFHANFFMSGLVADLLKKALHVPYVITFHALGRVRRLHQGDSDGFPKERMAIEDYLVRSADRIIAECRQDREDLLHLYQADPESISVVPCGFNPDEFWPVDRDEARALIGIPSDVPLLLQLGRIVPRKGIETVVRALRPLQRVYALSPKLVIVGGDSESPDETQTPEIGRLRRIAREMNVSDRVIFVGRRCRRWLKYFYSAADLFVTTPWYEPFGITPLEAMACGTPVIASAVGGLLDSVDPGKTGFLIPPKNPFALSQASAHFLSSRTLAMRMRQQAIDHVRSAFTWKHVAHTMDSVYRNVLTASSLVPVTLMQRRTTEPWMFRWMKSL